jgi:hypothetical protein
MGTGSRSAVSGWNGHYKVWIGERDTKVDAVRLGPARDRLSS